MEHYLSHECTSKRRICDRCQGSDVYPLSREQGKTRTIQWWCRTCRGGVGLQFTPPTMDPRFLDSLGVRRFTGLRFLSLQLTDADIEYLCERLPLGKSEGRDGMPYELIRCAALFAHHLLRRAYDEILAGAPIPDEWIGSICSYLFKRHPDFFLENLRPVKLLPTTYKGLTTIIDSRLKAEMEHLGMLELTQGGFRPGMQTQASIIRLQ
eukprot:629524-Rhodomonas_salina.2